MVLVLQVQNVHGDGLGPMLQLSIVCGPGSVHPLAHPHVRFCFSRPEISGLRAVSTQTVSKSSRVQVPGGRWNRGTGDEAQVTKQPAARQAWVCPF